MSLARMFLSGLLIAGGLILGVFALHGYLDPHWMQNQLQANARERPAEPKAINTFQNRNRFVATRSERQNAAAAPPIAKVEAKTAETGAVVKVAAKAPAKKKPADKGDKADKTKRPQQATVQWPWYLFSN